MKIKEIETFPIYIRLSDNNPWNDSIKVKNEVITKQLLKIETKEQLQKYVSIERFLEYVLSTPDVDLKYQYMINDELDPSTTEELDVSYVLPQTEVIKSIEPVYEVVHPSLEELIKDVSATIEPEPIIETKTKRTKKSKR